jgi:spore germination protein YaaH
MTITTLHNGGEDMDRQFFGSPFFFNPFFFPRRRRLFPFFFFFPFTFFPFFREGEERDGMYYVHTCQEGETMTKLAKKYNVPQPILETINPHLQNPAAFSPGETIYVPRMDKMYCQTMYMEDNTQYIGQQTTPYATMPSAMYPTQQMTPYTGMYPQMQPYTGTYPQMYPDQQQTMPYTGVSYQTDSTQSDTELES